MRTPATDLREVSEWSSALASTRGGPARALQNEAVRNDRWRWERGAGSVQLFPLTLTGPGTGRAL